MAIIKIDGDIKPHSEKWRLLVADDMASQDPFYQKLLKAIGVWEMNGGKTPFEIHDISLHFTEWQHRCYAYEYHAARKLFESGELDKYIENNED